jgi:hypothetical protein
MTDPIEDLLRRMPLSKPPPSLDARVLAVARTGGASRTDAPAPIRRRILFLTGAGGLAAAAAFAVAIGIPRINRPSGPPAMPAAAPVGAVENALRATAADATAPIMPIRLTQNLIETVYEGVILLNEGVPLRRFRRITFERIRWVDEARGVTLESTIPHEEILWVQADVH